MPTPPKKHRTYCKSCKNFTIHSRGLFEEYLSCEICETIETGYNISEVEPKLIEQQRERYTQMRSNYFGGLFGKFMVGAGIQAIMDLDNISQRIIECDAGQKAINEQIKQSRLERIEERQKIKQDFKDNYGKLGRNDKCSCGSGKKFKKCHLLIFREKGIKF